MTKEKIINIIENFEDKYALLRLFKSDGFYKSDKLLILKTKLTLKLFNKLTEDLEPNINWEYKRNISPKENYTKKGLYRTRIFRLYESFILQSDNDDFNVLGFIDFLQLLEELKKERIGSDNKSILNLLDGFIVSFILSNRIRIGRVIVNIDSNVRMNNINLVNILNKLHEEISLIEGVDSVYCSSNVYHSDVVNYELNRLLDKYGLAYYNYKDFS